MLRELLGLAVAASRLLVCTLAGHQDDPAVPSPLGLVYCSRCRGRHPVKSA